MISPHQLEEAYQEFSKNLQKWAPDGIITVNLNLLEELSLLSHTELEQNHVESTSHCFHVIETAEKVTLFNEQFAVWIVPKGSEESASTMTYVALIQGNKTHPELVFLTSGVYNSPRYILKVLQHVLTDVMDTEKLIHLIGKKEYKNFS